MIHLETTAEHRDLFCQENTPEKGRKPNWKIKYLQGNSLPVMAEVRPCETSE